MLRLREETRYVKIAEMRKAGLAFSDIGKKLGISRQRVFQIYTRIMEDPDFYQAGGEAVRNGQPGHVYIIGSTRLGWYKIGLSCLVLPMKRIKSLSQGLPFEIDFIKMWKSDHCVLTENRLHKKFNSYHLRGEWFSLKKNQIRDIEKLFLKGI